MRLPGWLRRVKPLSAPLPGGLDRGVLLRGNLWTGAGTSPRDLLPDAAVLVDAYGRIAWRGRFVDAPTSTVPVLGDGSGWLGPGVVDAHVHLAFGGPEEALRGGVVGVRDLGSPPSRLAGWSGCCAPHVQVAGPVIGAPGGYPTRTWGRGGFGAAAATPEQARALVGRLDSDGVDLVKIALEPADDQPVPSRQVLRAVIDEAHHRGLAVTCHALSADMVRRAVDAGVDELAHCPVEMLDDELMGDLARSGIRVVSTLQTLSTGADGRGPRPVAAALVAAGVELVHGTDLGNTGTRTGVDPRELDRLADAGLGREGALLAAVTAGVRSVGRGRNIPDGRVAVGGPANLVLLHHDPLHDPSVWRAPQVVVAGGRLVRL